MLNFRKQMKEQQSNTYHDFAELSRQCQEKWSSTLKHENSKYLEQVNSTLQGTMKKWITLEREGRKEGGTQRHLSSSHHHCRHSPWTTLPSWRKRTQNGQWWKSPRRQKRWNPCLLIWTKFPMQRSLCLCRQSTLKHGRPTPIYVRAGWEISWNRENTVYNNKSSFNWLSGPGEFYFQSTIGCYAKVVSGGIQV